MRHMCPTVIRRVVTAWIAIVVCVMCAPSIALAGDPCNPPATCDPLIPALRRMDQFFQHSEVNGIVLDWRVVINATEAARLSVVPQLLGYTELYRVSPLRRIRRDIVERADFLLEHSAEYRSHSVFDGMLGYAFLEAYEATGDSRYLAIGNAIVDELKAMSHSEYILNGGLMAAMAFAKHFRVTGNTQSESLTHEILSNVPQYQHPDGSFPHWCPSSTDIHYTGWMSNELILIRRLVPDPVIDPMLAAMGAFLEARVGSDGVTRYEEPCDDYQGCMRYYYSIASGCDFDYDTRAFTNELGYNALVFDHLQSPRYDHVMRFLGSIETRGTYADKWDFWPPPEDPYYVWTTADTSVVNISLIFWSLSSALAGRPNPIPDPMAWIPDEQDGVIEGIEGAQHVAPPSITPNPARENCTVRFVVPATGRVTVQIYDLAGRKVRTLVTGTLGAGEHDVGWDRRDDAGRACANGLYFARLRIGDAWHATRVLLTP